MEEHFPTLTKHSQKINLALAGFLSVALLITVLSVNSVRSIDSQAAKPTPTNTVSASISLNEPPSSLRLGSTVTFTNSVPKLAGWEYPMIAVWCYQGSSLVYMQLDHPETTFVLGGGSSDWKTNGGAADCKGVLYSYGSKGWKEDIRALAETPMFYVSE